MHSGCNGAEVRTKASMVVGLGLVADPTHRLSKLIWVTSCMSDPDGNSTRYAIGPHLVENSDPMLECWGTRSTRREGDEDRNTQRIDYGISHIVIKEEKSLTIMIGE
ncbi:hypothetical protein Tco_0934911 [Tanacetum coccineum]